MANLLASGKGINLYGTGIKYTVSLTDITNLGANLTGTVTLDNLPSGAIIQLFRIKHSVALAGPSLTAATAQLITPNNNYGSAFNVFQAVGNTVHSTVGNLIAAPLFENIGSTTPLQLSIVLTGANANVLTAGTIAVFVQYTVLL